MMSITQLDAIWINWITKDELRALNLALLEWYLRWNRVFFRLERMMHYLLSNFMATYALRSIEIQELRDSFLGK